jgi:hypothetical protein
MPELQGLLLSYQKVAELEPLIDAKIENQA